jgi:hypothetical protein
LSFFAKYRWGVQNICAHLNLSIEVKHVSGTTSRIKVKREDFEKMDWIALSGSLCIIEAGRVESVKKAIRAMSDVQF